MIKPRARRGATLPEIMLTSSVFLVLLTGLVSMGVNAASEYSRNSSKMMADNDASLALQALAREVRNGTSVTVASPTDMTVVMPAVNSQGDYDRYRTGESVRYYLQGNKLYRKRGAADATLVVKKLASATFQKQSTVDGVRLRLTLTCRQQQGTTPKESTFSTDVTLRNEPLP